MPVERGAVYNTMGARSIMSATLQELIRAVCADYKRRDALIIAGEMPRRVDMELRYLNFKIFDATAMVVGESEAERFIYEVGNKIGYANSNVLDMSESTYKICKKEVIDNIARCLYLIAGR